ncbi:MAG TPA: ribosome biogenesis GTP-binding protein YihA/YsxC [Steroidobacteraceae bacterium]|nr:ribosome biogenesis GTP-binding protein YihA/YsxC [Steroidobacteraceae bacterium]
MSRYPGARFLASAGSSASFGDDSGYEVAIAGRSNSGKSSALNSIVRNRGLARTSAMPGRTQAVNIFELEPGRRIVDLPGYGHARVPTAVQEAWARLMDAYFAQRRSLSGLFIVVDARRGFGASDEAMLAYALARGLPSHVLLSKADKLRRSEAAEALVVARRALAGRAGVQTFSAESGEGVDAARGALEAMLSKHAKTPGDP